MTKCSQVASNCIASHIMLTDGSYVARIAGIVPRHLEKRFEWVSFDAIMVVLRTDQWGDTPTLRASPEEIRIMIRLSLPVTCIVTDHVPDRGRQPRSRWNM